MTSDEAWSALVSADEEKDLDDFKVYFLEYVRNNKDLTFVDLEKKFRAEGLSVYLIAMVLPSIALNPLSSLTVQSDSFMKEKEIPLQKTIRNLQGETGKRYLVSFQLGSQNRRTRYPSISLPLFNTSATRGQVAASAEENVGRLANAGFLVEDIIPVCFNCGAKGHGRSECREPPEGKTPSLNNVGGLIFLLIDSSDVDRKAKDCPDGVLHQLRGGRP